jgi:type III pantothenate kinase
MTDATTLAVDIGNTNLHIGLFAGDHIITTWSLQTDTGKEIDDWGVSLLVLFQQQDRDLADVDYAVLGSVVPPLTPVFEELLQRYCSLEPLVVRGGTRTGVPLRYEPLFDLGADRIAHAVAADKLYETPAIVVDFGTATTFDAIGPDGAYLGGAIAPGLTIAANALWERTAQLRRIDLRFPQRAIGRNTTEAVQSGLMHGHIGQTREMINRIRAELDDVRCVIATGKHANLIAPHVENIDVVDPNLTLQGLRLIHELNTTPSRGAKGITDGGTAA